jgi:carbamate kinase
MTSGQSVPMAVVGLGGNALLPRGETPEADLQLKAVREAAVHLAAASRGHRLVVTHGNGPQVGLLALMGDSFAEVAPYPLDVLDAESEGQIGYLLEMEIDNASGSKNTVALITRVVVDREDPAFSKPSKFIGAAYDEDAARQQAAERGWQVAPDGDCWRRVVASPEPRRIVQLPAIQTLVESGFLVVCAGGGGIPVIEAAGGHRGIEAVIDKDLCSARLAGDLGARVLVLATDVDAVYLDWGEADQRPVSRTTPEELRSHRFPAGSMGPKVEACCRMVEETGGRAAIGALGDLEALLDGSAGTQILPDGSLADTEGSLR